MSTILNTLLNNEIEKLLESEFPQRAEIILPEEITELFNI